MKDGGSAFPCFAHPNSKNGQGMSGMSLRDYFAAKALQGMLSHPGLSKTDGSDYGPSDVAQAAFELADAMLAEREK